MRGPPNGCGKAIRTPPVYRADATTCVTSRTSPLGIASPRQTPQGRSFHRVVTSVLTAMNKVVTEEAPRTSGLPSTRCCLSVSIALYLVPVSLHMALAVVIVVTAKTANTLSLRLLKRPRSSPPTSLFSRPLMACKNTVPFACTTNTNH